MGRHAGGLPAGVGVGDHISLGVMAKTFPRERVDQVLRETQTASQRQRDRPAHGVVYYVIAMALSLQGRRHDRGAALFAGGLAAAVGCRGGQGGGQGRDFTSAQAAGRASTRVRGGAAGQWHEQGVQPIASRATRGAWYRRWQLVSLDGSCLDVPGTPANRAGFGSPGSRRGASAYPQLRFASLLENGTHVLFGARLGRDNDSETTLARAALGALRPGLLCLADRQFLGYALWRDAAASGAELPWRVKTGLRLAREKALAEGSFLSTIYPASRHRKRKQGGITVRVVAYHLHGVAGAEPRCIG
jgi:hypothetical protein